MIHSKSVLLLANQLEALVSLYIIFVLQAVTFLEQMEFPMELFQCFGYLMTLLVMLIKEVARDKSCMIDNNSPTTVMQAGNSSSSPPLLNSASGLKYDTGLAVDWSSEEQYKLEESLIKYKTYEPPLNLAASFDEPCCCFW